MLELINSPFALVIFIIIWLPFIWWLKRKRGLRCDNCGGNRVQQMETTAQGIVHSANQFTGQTGVNTKVKYRCLDCKASFVFTENRS